MTGILHGNPFFFFLSHIQTVLSHSLLVTWYTATPVHLKMSFLAQCWE